MIVYGNMDSCIFTSDMGRDWNCVSLAPDVSARVSDTFLPPVGPEVEDVFGTEKAFPYLTNS